MRLLATRLFGIPFLALLCAAPLHAQQVAPSAVDAVPRLVRIAGSFRPADGLPPAPVETVTLAIYAEETGGTPLWQETQNVTIEAQGRYSIVMGATLPDGLPEDLFASGGARWLGVQFERAGEQEQPRALWTSVPYALRASDADTLGGRPAADYLLTPDAARDGGSTGAANVDPAPGASTKAVLAGTPNFLAKYVNTADVGDSAVFESGNRVGIGTTVPLDSLHLSFTNTNGSATGLAVQNLSGSANAYSGMLFYDQNGALGQFQGFNNTTHEYRINNIARVSPGGAFNGSINFMLGGASKFIVAPNGNIGIGTPTGTARLTVRANPSFTATGTVSTTSGSSTLAGVGTKFLTELNVGDRVAIGMTTVAVFSISSDTLASISTTAPTVTGASMTILPSMLRVQTSAGGLGFQVNDIGAVSIGGAVTSGTNKLYITDTNRFPNTSTGSFLTNGNVTVVTTTTQAADVGAVLALGGSRGSTGVSSLAGIRGAKENSTDADPSGYLGLYTVDGMSTFAERMRVTSTGLVGIGTKTPTRELEVNGGVRMNTVAAKPACNATVRGTFWVTQGGAGVKDSVEVCAKDAMETFAWRTLF